MISQTTETLMAAAGNNTAAVPKGLLIAAVIVLFTVSFIVSGIITYRIRAGAGQNKTDSTTQNNDGKDNQDTEDAG